MTWRTVAIFTLCIGMAGSLQAAVFDVPASDENALAQALLDANANAENDVIRLAAGGAYRIGENRYGGCQAGAHLPPIEGRVILEGNGAVIDGRNADTQLLCVAEAGDLTIQDLHITRFDVLEYALQGVVANNGTLAMNRISVSQSTARAPGNFGAAFPRPVIANNGVMSLRNVTVTSSRGNAIGNGGSMTIENGTIAGNGGVGLVYGGQGLTVTNSIVAGNGEADCTVSALTSLGHNLDSDGSCGFDEPTDLSAADPLLGAFGDHGGPVPTMALRSGSPALDAGDPSRCTLVDGRGFVRAHGPNRDCDIGSFERDGRTSDIGPALTATWFDVREDGHFFSVQVLDGDRDEMLLFWNSFDAEGNPLWLNGLAGIRGHRVDMVLSRSGGMRYPDFDPSDRRIELWGTLTLAFSSCWQAVALYEPLDPELAPATSRLIRLTKSAGLSCGD